VPITRLPKMGGKGNSIPYVVKPTVEGRFLQNELILELPTKSMPSFRHGGPTATKGVDITRPEIPDDCSAHI
jgi:hypothetical protein